MSTTTVTTNHETDLEVLEGGVQVAILCHLSDLGNGKRFAIHYGDRLRYCHDKKTWLAFDGHRWNPKTGDETARKYAKETALGIYDEAKLRSTPHEREQTARWAAKSERAGLITAMLSMAETEIPISTYSDKFDTDIFLFNAQDWLIDLRTGGISPPHPEHNITQSGGCKFDETATCPTWLRCIDEWMAGDVEKIDYLQRVLGYCLTGDTTARLFPIFHGGGANGKSKCLDTIIEIMGDYAGVGSEDLLAEKKCGNGHPCDIADLKGKRLVVVDESKKSMRLRTSLVKRMTGDRTLKGRLMRQNFQEFRVTHKVILMTQNLPIVTETSNAIWDRLHILKWPVEFPPEKRDPNLTDKLRPEYPGILNWLIAGCLKWQADGRIIRPGTVENATLLFREESDPLAEFVEERCIIAEPNTTTKKLMRADYEMWSESNNRYKFSPQNFNAYLRECGAVDVSLKINGNAHKCWQGIGLIGNNV